MSREEYRARIPDEDAYNWIKTLLEGGFTTKEVDDIMTHLNDTYLEKIKGKAAVDEVVDAVEKYLSSIDVEINAEVLQHIRAWVFDKIREAEV